MDRFPRLKDFSCPIAAVTCKSDKKLIMLAVFRTANMFIAISSLDSDFWDFSCQGTVVMRRKRELERIDIVKLYEPGEHERGLPLAR